MTGPNSKIIILQDYARTRALLKQGNVQTVIEEQRTELRQFETEVLDLLPVKHKLKDAQILKDKSIIYERNLTQIFNWLEDKIADKTDNVDDAMKQALLKQCEQLISKNERIKKNLTDDLAACRYVETKEALDPLKILGTVTGSTIAALTLTRALLSDKANALWQAAEVGVVLGVVVAFHRQAKTMCDITKEAMVESPRHLNSLRKSARNSIFAAALTASVAAKKISEIEPLHPARLMYNSRPAFAAKIS